MPHPDAERTITIKGVECPHCNLPFDFDVNVEATVEDVIITLDAN